MPAAENAASAADTGTSKVPVSARRVWSAKQIALALFIMLVAIYHVNGTVLEEGDPVPNIKLPVTLLKRGTLSFSPDDFPEMFRWQSEKPLTPLDAFPVQKWDDPWGEKTMGEWRQSGALHLNGPRYHLLESPVRGVYVSTFGPIPGITFTPLVALLRLFAPNYDSNHLLGLSAGKFHGSMLTAACAVFLFFTALRFTTRWRALLIAATFGLATCAWAVQSQNVWQQTVSTFFICIGICSFVCNPDSARNQLVAGFAFGTATACRHTGALISASVFIYSVLYHRKAAVYMALGAIPVPAAIGFYNWYYFGSPFSFGQELVGHGTAFEKTGSPDLWQTPFFKGLAGLLFSPSRGLLVFSPFFVLAPYGIYRIFRNIEYRTLRPFIVGSFAIMVLQCKWFDWWGGWTYGYRPWLDAIPVLVLCLIPTLDLVAKTPIRRTIFGATLVWAAFVQFLGAFTYDKFWNERTLYVVQVPGKKKPDALFSADQAEGLAQESGGTYLGPTKCNIDMTYCRYRLWAPSDSIIIYYLTHFRESRIHRPRTTWSALFRRR